MTRRTFGTHRTRRTTFADHARRFRDYAGAMTNVAAFVTRR